jgi:hypothetical protein
MRPILVSTVLAVGLVWCGSLTFAREAGPAEPPHAQTPTDHGREGPIGVSVF